MALMCKSCVVTKTECQTTIRGVGGVVRVTRAFVLLHESLECGRPSKAGSPGWREHGRMCRLVDTGGGA
jgi:hypothetical protein